MPLDGIDVTQRLLDPLFTTPEMQKIFSDRNYVEQMLTFEVALLKALESTGFASRGSSMELIACSQEIKFDFQRLAQECGQSGNVAIPFLKQITSALPNRNSQAAAFVHWGATSQDVQDTATILLVRAGVTELVADIDSALKSIANLTRQFSGRLMAGRTWLQQGPPVTFGLKMAGYLDALLRHRKRLLETKRKAELLSFGGAVGTLAPFGVRGKKVAALIAQELRLQVSDISWHSHRDRLADVACCLGLLAGTLGKLGRDISLLMQTEIAEVAEPFADGRSNSSTMPHKRNPVSSGVMLSAAIRVPSLVATMLMAMVQEHERGLGGWHAEWETLPEIFRLTAGSMRHARDVLDGLEVHGATMVKNLEATQGGILSEAVALALARNIGKREAHRLLEEATRKAKEQNVALDEILREQIEVRKHLSVQEIDVLLNPENYLGTTSEQIAAILASYEEEVRADM